MRRARVIAFVVLLAAGCVAPPSNQTPAPEPKKDPAQERAERQARDARLEKMQRAPGRY